MPPTAEPDPAAASGRGTAGSPTDWVSGERVFGPPGGTVDVDWLVPALLEREPGLTPAAAGSALRDAWSAWLAAAGDEPLTSVSAADLVAEPGAAGRVRRSALAVVAEAVRTYAGG